MARAIFGTYPEIEKKCIFLKIDIVKFFFEVWLFLGENIGKSITILDFKNRSLRWMGREPKRTFKFQKNRFYFEKLNNFLNRIARVVGLAV